jgi:hypothetical protein
MHYLNEAEEKIPEELLRVLIFHYVDLI